MNYFCPVCRRSHNHHRWVITGILALCNIMCKEVWNRLTWEERETLVDLTD